MKTPVFEPWLLAGVLFGVCGLGYVAFFADQRSDGLISLFVLFPMVSALALAGMANLFFWMATKRSIRDVSNDPDSMRVALKRAEDSNVGRMFVATYRILQPSAMLAAGYVSICWVIGIVLLSRS